MRTGVLWEDIQVGKLYTSNQPTLLGAWRTPFFLNQIIDPNDFVYVSLKQGDPVLVISRYFDKASSSSWLKILHNDKSVWFRYDGFLVYLENE